MHKLLSFKKAELEFGTIMDLFSLYVLFSHFRPRDVLMGIFLSFFHKLCVHLHVHKTNMHVHVTTFEEIIP